MRAWSLFNSFVFSLAVSSGALAKLLVDFKGGDDPSKLGKIELERHFLGDHVAAGKGGNDVYIKNDEDKTLDRPSLHFHRSPHFRRAELRFLDREIEEGKTYYLGYQFRLPRSRAGLVVFQWKKLDKYAKPTQNIPFHMEFKSRDQITLDYTTPDSGTEPGAGRKPVWHGNLTTGDSQKHIHSLGFVINTDNSGKGWLEFYFDGKKQKFDNGEERLKNIFLFTGTTFPKIGLYRGEAAVGDERNPEDHTFDNYVYRVQVSDSSLDEIAESAGLKRGEPPASDPEPTSSETPTASPELAPSSTAPPEPTAAETSSPSAPPKTCKGKNKSKGTNTGSRRRHRRDYQRRHNRRHWSGADKSA